MSLYDLILLPENFVYAWNKVKRLYGYLDGYADHAELAEFELNLERRLQAIRNDFENGHYRPDPIRALPRPKKIEDVAKDRQYFHVSVRDQVAWMAISNALGPALDEMMPPWSYGNRLYRAAWYDTQDSIRSKLELGPYRHASGNLYRKFQQSWPLFRRHVAMTARSMVRRFEALELDKSDERAVASAEADGLPYLNADFWSKPRQGAELYHASIDLKEFFPSVSVDAVLKGLDFGIDAQSGKAEILKLVKSMLAFEVRLDHLPEYLVASAIPAFQSGSFSGIPTGLFVAGLLANVALLPVDNAINAKINEQRNVAHFRFVDDHVLLAHDFDALCQWIEEYKATLALCGIEAKINTEKTDPPPLASWLQNMLEPVAKPELRESAILACKIDGANPTQLLTKTLAQVSAIAATNADVLDDDDVADQLKLLEWLLLADLPEREIRPDTRAAFAAGQIAKLVPILLQEENGLVDLLREFAAFELSIGPGPYGKSLNLQRREWAKRISLRSKEHKRDHSRHLRHCFNLLMQAFEGHPAKARLFHRLHDYCRLTGHEGLNRIDDWLKGIKRKHPNWGNYYAGLSLQILASGIPRAVNTLISNNALRSDVSAAFNYLSHVVSLRKGAFAIPSSQQAWFHRRAMAEIAYATYGASLVLKPYKAYDRLSEKLFAFGKRFTAEIISPELATADEHYSKGVWAHLLEGVYAKGRTPSPVWNTLVTEFDYSNPEDLVAARRYPQAISDAAWEIICSPDSEIRENDGGWIREAIEARPDRMSWAAASTRRAFSRAAKVTSQDLGDWLNAVDWSRFAANECHAFDPRRSEWTALEIVRQLLTPLQEIGTTLSDFEGIHPYNVVISKDWMLFGSELIGNGSWETWRRFAQRKDAVRLVKSAERIKDYRYHVTAVGQHLNPWFPHLRAFGQLLLGLLACDHSTPAIWNLRGNEQVVSSGRGRLLRSLSVSSRTALILDSCLSGRSAETRIMISQPELFGLTLGQTLNDIKFDAAPLVQPNDLLNAVKYAQSVLEENQIAVSLNQPRQLIPFRLKDFALAADGADEGDNAQE